MFERFRKRSDRDDDYVENRGGVATATRRDRDGDGVADSDERGTVVRDRPGPAGPIAIVVGDNEQIRSQAIIFVGATEAARLIKIFRDQSKAQAWLNEPHAGAALDSS